VIRFRPRFGPFNAFVLFAVFVCRAALAAPNDADASKLRQQAIEQDYLATDFAAAEAKLAQALTLCKDRSSCAPAVSARIHCDFGVVYFAQQKKDEADAQFAAALKDDPNVTIGPDLSTPELRKEFAAVKDATPASAESADAGAAPDAAESAPSPPPHKTSPSSEVSDCPPGFPGCKAASPSVTCSTNDDCSGGETCRDGSCGSGESTESAGDAKAKANWLSLAVEQDFLLLPSANNVCAGGSGYTCFDGNGRYDNQLPITGVSTADSVNGGLSPATLRIMLGYDRAFGSNITLGTRLGFAISSAPNRPGGAAFFPVHLEARATYWIGHNALARKGFRPFVLAAGGGAEVAASLTAFVYNVNAAPNSAASQYQAWKRVGQGFLALGLGTMFAFAPNNGIVLEVRGMELFPTSGTALGVQLGYTLGL
jgi:hypothetical protein